MHTYVATYIHNSSYVPINGILVLYTRPRHTQDKHGIHVIIRDQDVYNTEAQMRLSIITMSITWLSLTYICTYVDKYKQWNGLLEWNTGLDY